MGLRRWQCSLRALDDASARQAQLRREHGLQRRQDELGLQRHGERADDAEVRGEEGLRRRHHPILNLATVARRDLRSALGDRAAVDRLHVLSNLFDSHGFGPLRQLRKIPEAWLTWRW
eukprot:7172044-Prymnesium_polylepis.1